MHTEHAAGSFLGEIINRTPKTGQIEVVLMKANNKQIGEFPFKELKYRLHPPPLYDRPFCANSILPGQQRCLLVQFNMGSPAVFLHRVGSSWIDNDGKRSVGRK